ncbi:MAG: NAD+ synthase [Vulcanimicrobiota bacterium]
MEKIRIAMAQINSTVGDFEGNLEKITEYINKARRSHADVIIFPELAICGYPPEDLILRTSFIRQNRIYLEKVASEAQDIAVVVGFVEARNHIYNSAAFIYDSRVYGTYRKVFLPNYGVFDEKRYFSSGPESPIFEFGNVSLGINICEDIWIPDGPAARQAVSGAGIILDINASPYQLGKWKLRENMISTRAADNAVYICYVNCVGGQDELIFEGGSLAFDPDGNMITRGKFFEEDYIVVDLDSKLPYRKRLHDLRITERLNFHREKEPVQKVVVPVNLKTRFKKHPIIPEITRKPLVAEEVYRAVMLGIKDYIYKNGFKKAVLGISGGIDSALVASLACDALGSENVTGILMPTRFTSIESKEDAIQLAANLNFKLFEIPIDKIYQHYLDQLEPVFEGLPVDVTEQNIQARIRGNLLMAFSNKFGALVLATGNKSEFSVGYSTLYGDMAGAIAPIKDIPKLMVYELAKYRNTIKIIIPARILVKAPTAELAEDQKDSDFLPPYDILDPILAGLVEEDKNIEELVEDGFEEATVRDVARMLIASEYKRRQGPPGIKVTSRAFGRDRRFPITNRFVE